MIASNSHVEEFRDALESHAADYDVEISPESMERLSAYYVLLNMWNPRLHLVAPCLPQEFARRHILESLMLLPHLPHAAKAADIGSGAGLPIIPCLIARPDINATLIESSKRKAVFLREALNRTDTSRSAKVITERFQEIAAPDVAFVICRALERFTHVLPSLIKWAPSTSTLLLFGGEALRGKIETAGLSFTEIKIPHSQRRFLFAARQVEKVLP